MGANVSQKPEQKYNYSVFCPNNRREKIKKEEEGIKKLEKEIENLKTLEIKGLINEVDIPYEELVKMIKELKN